MKAHNKGEGFKSVGVRPRDRITQPHFQPYLRVYVQRLRAEDPHRQHPLVSFGVINNSRARLKPPRSSLSATSGLEVEKPAAGSVRSPYWASWTSCPVPRGSPPLPQAAWAWPEAARAESGCEGRRRVGQQDATSRRTCWRSDHPGQEEMPDPSPSPPPPSSPPLAAAASRHTTHTMMTSQLERIPWCGHPTETCYLTSEQEGRAQICAEGSRQLSAKMMCQSWLNS